MTQRRRFSRTIAVAGLLAAAVERARAEDLDAPEAPVPVYQISAQQIAELTMTSSQHRADGRRNAESALKREIDALGRVVPLSEPQRRKLELAGQIDVARFFEEADEIRRDFPSGAMTREQLVALFDRSRALRARYDAGLYGESSLFRRTIRASLDAEQRATWVAARREESDRRHRARVRRVVQSIGSSISLDDARRERLEQMILEKTEPPGADRSEVDGEARFMRSLVRIPDDDWKEILPDREWDTMVRLLGVFRAQAAAVNLKTDGE